MSLLEGLFGDSAADEAREREQERINAQYKYDKQYYKYNQQQAERQYEYSKEGLKIQKKNDKALINYEYQTAVQNAQYQQAINDYTYQSQLRQYQKSEEIYKQQLGFNSLAAQRAANSESRRMQDVVAEQAYQKQDLFIQLLQAEGMQMARGVSGKSVAKGMQSAIAQYGRNQAILADSMLSANREYRDNIEDIELSWYGADLAADANRMLEPLPLPGVPMPMKQPMPVYQDPLKPMAPPEPIKGTNTVPGGDYGSTLAGGALAAGASIGQLALSGNPITAPLAISSVLGIL